MKAEKYRIMKQGYGKTSTYLLVCTYGFCNVETLGRFAKQSSARAFAKDHAKKQGQVNPIICT